MAEQQTAAHDAGVSQSRAKAGVTTAPTLSAAAERPIDWDAHAEYRGPKREAE